MVGAMTRGLNMKSLTITILVVFAYVFVSDFLIHGLILKDAYMSSASLWRPEAEMQNYFLWMLFGQLLIAKFFVILFAKGYEGGGIDEGIRFGLFMAFFQAGAYFIQYAVTPLPSSILWAWIGLGLLQSVGGGIVATLVYKK